MQVILQASMLGGSRTVEGLGFGTVHLGTDIAAQTLGGSRSRSYKEVPFQLPFSSIQGPKVGHLRFRSSWVFG